MKSIVYRLAALIVLTVALLQSCASTQQPGEEPVAAERPAPAVDQPVPAAPGSPAPEIPAQEIPAPEEDLLPVLEPQDDEESFAVTEELFERTFIEVEGVISQLNAVIQRRDYRRWLNYLTPEYVAVHSDPETLRDISNMPILIRNDIVLRSLEDYFEWVVVPSRANARLDDLSFVNTDRVEAIMVVQNRPAILYRLRNVDGNWKVDVF